MLQGQFDTHDRVTFLTEHTKHMVLQCHQSKYFVLYFAFGYLYIITKCASLSCLLDLDVIINVRNVTLDEHILIVLFLTSLQLVSYKSQRPIILLVSTPEKCISIAKTKQLIT